MTKATFTLITITAFLFSSLGLNAQWSTEDLSSVRSRIGIGSVNGKVFFAGSSPSAEGKVLDIYDMGNGSWSTEELSVFRQFTFAVGIGNKMYFAGYTQTSEPDQDVIEVYDTNNGSWSTIEMPGIFGATSMTALDDLLVLVKGERVRMYNTTSSSWTEGTLSVDRILALAVGCNGTITFAGGGSFVGGLTDLVDIYDVENDSWSTGNMSAGKNGMKGACLNNKIYYVGGALGFSGDSFVTEIYDTETNTWSTMDLIQDKSNMGVAVTDNKLYMIGGKSDTTGDYLSEVEVVDGTTGEVSLDNISIARSNISAFAVNNTVFAAGGFDPESGEYVTTIDIYKEVISDVDDLGVSDYAVFPNPTSSDLNIMKDGAMNVQEISFEIYNAMGSQVDQGICQTILKLSNLVSGVYYVKLLDENQSMIKVVKW